MINLELINQCWNFDSVDIDILDEITYRTTKIVYNVDPPHLTFNIRCNQILHYDDELKIKSEERYGAYPNFKSCKPEAKEQIWQKY